MSLRSGGKSPHVTRPIPFIVTECGIRIDDDEADGRSAWTRTGGSRSAPASSSSSCSASSCGWPGRSSSPWRWRSSSPSPSRRSSTSSSAGRSRSPWPWSLVLLLSFLVLYLIGTVFYSGGKSLASELPSYTEMVRSFLERIDALVPDPRLKVGLTEWIQSLNIGRLGAFLVSALGPFLAFMSDLLLVFIFMIFILAGRGRMIRKFDEAFPPGPGFGADPDGLPDRPRDPEVPRRQDPDQPPHRRPHGFGPGRLRGPLRRRLRRPGLPLQLRPDPRADRLRRPARAPGALPGRGDSPGRSGWSWSFSPRSTSSWTVSSSGGSWAKEIKLSPLLVLFSLFFGAWLWGIPGLVLAVPILTALRIVFENVPSLRFLGAMMDK